MKKSAQIAINNAVVAAYTNYYYEHEPIISSRRLNYCKAFILETPNYFALRSYDTVIAIIDKRTDVMYDFLRLVYGYMATSAHHADEFDALFEPSARFNYYPVY